MLPVYSDELENAVLNNDRVFLYLYTSKCGYCVKFEPIYKRLFQEFRGKYKFLKINADSEYGRQVMYEMGGFYVPYVLVINHKKQKVNRLAPNCILNYNCSKLALDEFMKY